MKKKLSSFFLVSLLCSLLSSTQAIAAEGSRQTVAQADWLVVGAGPAAIAVIGILLMFGQKVVWIDKGNFNVGALSDYPGVPSNSTVGRLKEFLCSCPIFFTCSPALGKIENLDPANEHFLSLMVEVLADITQNLKTVTTPFHATMTGITLHDCWHVETTIGTIEAQHVVLATGARPKKIALPYDIEEIPFKEAIDKERLQKAVTTDDTVGVIGSAHSALLITKHLIELELERVIQFYKRPLEEIAPQLGGETARWVYNVLMQNPPASLLRVPSTQENLEYYLQECTKVIQAIGFERTPLPTIPGYNPDNYNDLNGTIAPKLFGIGIAFPERYIDQYGQEVDKVGLNRFLEYAQRIVPEWLLAENIKRSACVPSITKLFDQLFMLEEL